MYSNTSYKFRRKKGPENVPTIAGEVTVFSYHEVMTEFFNGLSYSQNLVPGTGET